MKTIILIGFTAAISIINNGLRRSISVESMSFTPLFQPIAHYYDLGSLFAIKKVVHEEMHDCRPWMINKRNAKQFIIIPDVDRIFSADESALLDAGLLLQLSSEETCRHERPTRKCKV